MDRYDSIIVGAGHTGLVCAAYLANSGQRVLVVEAADAPELGHQIECWHKSGTTLKIGIRR